MPSVLGAVVIRVRVPQTGCSLVTFPVMAHCISYVVRCIQSWPIRRLGHEG
jgi:hypothetical protein